MYSQHKRVDSENCSRMMDGHPPGNWSLPSRLPESAKKTTLTLSAGYGPKSGLGTRTNSLIIASFNALSHCILFCWLVRNTKISQLMNLSLWRTSTGLIWSYKRLNMRRQNAGHQRILKSFSHLVKVKILLSKVCLSLCYKFCAVWQPTALSYALWLWGWHLNSVDK